MIILGLEYTVEDFQKFWKAFSHNAQVQTVKSITHFFAVLFLVHSGKYGEMAAIAMADTFYGLILRPFSSSVTEVCAIRMTKQFGAQVLYKLSRTAQQAVYMMWFLLAMFAILVYYVRDIMTKLQLAPHLVDDTCRFVYFMYPVVIAELLNETTKIFLTSQSISKPYEHHLLFMVCQSFVVNLFLVYILKLGGLGLIGARLIQEAFYFIIYQTRKYANGDPAIIAWQPPEKVLHGIFKTARKVVESVYVAYGDHLCYYFSVVMLAVDTNNMNVAAWSAIGSVTKMLNSTATGFAHAQRKMIGTLLGAREPVKAKKLSMVVSSYNLMFSLFMSVCLIALAGPISNLFIAHTAVTPLIAMGLRTWGFFLIFHMQVHSFFTLLRLNNLDTFLWWVSGFINPICTILLISYLFLEAKLGLFGIYLGYGISNAVVTCVLLLRVYVFHDWRRTIDDPEENVYLSKFSINALGQI